MSIIVKHVRDMPLCDPFVMERESDRAIVIHHYRLWLTSDGEQAAAARAEVWRLADLVATGDLTLYCWCKPYACHGDVVKDLIETSAAVVHRHPSRHEPIH